jgi:hypothetical protein
MDTRFGPLLRSFVVLAASCAGMVAAQAATIPAIGNGASVSVLQNDIDVTASWLPEPGQSVRIVVNDANGVPLATQPSITLVPPPPPPYNFNGGANPFITAQTTSAYRGICTNFGLPTDLSPDFTLAGNVLTATDCGGRAVIKAGGFTFVLPQDSNNNGIADVWEARFGANMSPIEDADTGPVVNPSAGDGISNFDEYRGFMVSGQHVRTDPRQKDLFVHMVNPQCGGATDVSLFAGPAPIVNGADLFATVNSLISGNQVHALNFTPGAANTAPPTEWVDNFVSFTVASGITLTAGGAATDRQININAVYPILDTVANSTIQKGVRIIECLDASRTSPLGLAGANGTPNGGAGYAILYTRRIVNFINTLLGGTLQYSNFVNGSWTTPVASFVDVDGTFKPIDAAFLISKATQYYLAMEIGHSIKLTPAVEGTKSTTYGYHHAPGTGTNLDQTFNRIVKGANNTFYIPSLYGSNDQANFKLKN